MKRNLHHTGLRGGFTLIEILVVLVIMGFLVAMVAPKLSGIVNSAVDTTCDTNQERLRTVLNAYVNQNNGLPGGLVNMIKYADNYTVDANVQIPSGDDQDKASKEFLSWEMVERMKPAVYFLNEAEAEEISKGLGIKQIRTLAKVDAGDLALTVGDAEEDKILESNVMTSVQAGIPVFMIGLGADTTGTLSWAEGNLIEVDANSVVTESNTTTSVYDGSYDGSTVNVQGAITDFVRFDEGKNLGRIVLGVSNMGTLVQDGWLEESGTCPGQLQRADHHTWGNYLVILPRLSSTMDRIADADGDGEDLIVQYIALDTETGTEADDAKILGRAPNAGFSKFTAQEATDFTTACPEGHTWGAIADAFAIKVRD